MFSLLKPHLVSFGREGRHEHQVMIGNRLVGRYIPPKNKWQIRPPFKLFLDEMSLSDLKEKHENLVWALKTGTE